MPENPAPPVATAADWVEFLGEASATLSASLDFETTLASLARLCVARFADWCSVEVTDEDGTSRQIALAHADADKVELARDLQRDLPADCGAGRVMRTGQPELHQDISVTSSHGQAMCPEHENFVRALGLRSAMFVPIELRGQVLGTLMLARAERGPSFGDDDFKIAQELGRRAAQAIENARAYDMAQDARRRAEEAADRLGLLAQLSAAIAPALQPIEALDKLARFIVSHIADYCVAYRVDDAGAIRRVARAHADERWRDLVEELVRVAPPQWDDGYGVGAVVRDGVPVLVSEIPADMLAAAAHSPEHLDVLQRLAPRSSIIVPLQARGRTLGAMAIATTDRSGRRYTEADLTLLEEIAGRAALLVDNAILYSEAQLATQARDEMLAVVSHDLRGPIHAILVGLDHIEEDGSAAHHLQTRSGIRGAAKQMDRLVADLLDASMLDAGRLVLKRAVFDVGALLNEVVSVHRATAESRTIALVTDTPDEPLEFDGDRNRLGQAITNLVDNALKFTPRDGTVQLSATREPGEVQITVANSGPPIPAEELPHLFDRFWQSGRRDKRGVGLGLAIAHGVAEAHGGRIDVASDSSGTRFTIVLPSPPS